jgi:phosphoribosylformylglycinamidine cyclo-ligase
MGRYDTIGRDLVAMCADDVVCLGARPLFMLDYVAVGRLEPEAVSEIVGGVADGCEEAGCALVGGETAEHPGLMEAEQFDLAGFCVGVVERSDLVDGTQAKEGDVILGLASSGLHANGYSLVRQLLVEHAIPLDRPFVECVQASLGERAAAEMVEQEPEHLFATLGDVLLAPSRIYARTVLDLRDLPEGEGTALQGLAHVTGGGLPGNVARALPEGLAAVVDPRAWRVPTVFRFLQALGGLEDDELRATLNCGIGMVAVLAPSIADRAAAFLLDRGIPAWPIGLVEPVSVPGGARYVESFG